MDLSVTTSALPLDQVATLQLPRTVNMLKRRFLFYFDIVSFAKSSYCLFGAGASTFCCHR